MDNIVEFSVPDFKACYPNFAQFNDAQLQMWFTKATLLCNNTPQSPVRSLPERNILLCLLVAHFASLQTRIEGGNEVVGRISGASEGSVSVSTDYGTTSSSEKWYAQTSYGAEYWKLTARYRSALYIVEHYPMDVKR